MTNGFLLGIFFMGCVTAALFFLRFWKDTRDAFFLYFAVAFFLNAVAALVVLSLPHPNVGDGWVHGLRLLSFVTILLAIWRKNASSRS